MGGKIRSNLSPIPPNPLITRGFLYHSRENNSRYRNRNAPKLSKNNTNIYNASVVVTQTDDIWGAGRRRFENLAMPIRLDIGARPST